MIRRWPEPLATAVRMARGYGRRIGAEPDDAEADLLCAYYADTRVCECIHTSNGHAWNVVRQVVRSAHQQRQPAGRRHAQYTWVPLEDRELDPGEDHWRVEDGFDPTGDTATTRVDVQRELARLHPNRAWALTAYEAGWSSAEIAERLGINSNTVKAVMQGRATGDREASVSNRVAIAQGRIESGMPLRHACREAGISENTFRRHARLGRYREEVAA